MKKLQTLLLAGLLALGMACGYGSKYNSMPTMGGGAPVLSQLAPSSVAAGSAAFVLTLNGSNFSMNSAVYFNGAVVATTFVSANQLTANIPASAVASSGMVPVYVRSGSQNSASMNFTVK